MSRVLCILSFVISLSAPLYAQAGGEIVSSHLRTTVAGQPRVELELRVVNQDGYGDTSSVLLSVDDTATWNSAGDERKFILVREYFRILDSLESAVARAADKPKAASYSFQSKQKINVNKASGYIALSEFGNVGESGGEILSAVQQTSNGEVRINLKIRVVNDANFGLTLSSLLLSAKDSASFIGGGQERDLLILRQYHSLFSSLERMLSSNTGSRSRVEKVNPVKAQGFVSLSNLNKVREENRAQIALLESQITSITSDITSISVRAATLEGIRYSDNNRDEYEKAQSERQDLFAKRIQLQSERSKLESERLKLRSLFPTF